MKFLFLIFLAFYACGCSTPWQDADTAGATILGPSSARRRGALRGGRVVRPGARAGTRAHVDVRERGDAGAAWGQRGRCGGGVQTVIRAIACATCSMYAWHSQMDPVFTASGWHHPACATEFPRTPLPPGTRLVATGQEREIPKRGSR